LSVVSQPSLFGPPQGGGSARANVDGGSRGNPGPAGYGVRIEQEDGSVVELKESIGVATNNVAEYSGLIAALAWAVAHGVSRLHVRADSDLLVKQMRGEYRVKSPGLQPLFEHARTLARQIGAVTFEHVRREFNKDADRLANEAMDEAAPG
jgi:probable phosphoglycerate mutase